MNDYDEGSGWRRIVAADVDRLTAEWLAIGLTSLREQLSADDLTADERAAIVRRATPLLEAHYRTHFLAACADAPHETVH